MSEASGRQVSCFVGCRIFGTLLSKIPFPNMIVVSWVKSQCLKEDFALRKGYNVHEVWKV